MIYILFFGSMFLSWILGASMATAIAEGWIMSGKPIKLHGKTYVCKEVQ
jgi:hypothetical protein